MSALFTINFRREAYVQEVSRRRRHMIALGVWVAYFGVLLVVIGLYGLNCMTLARRATLLERQTTLIRQAKGGATGAQISAGDLAQVESYVSGTRAWRDRMQRLGDLRPPEARLVGATVNPQNMTDATSRNALVIRGELHTVSGQDRMQGVMKIISAMRADSVFGRGYRNIRLSSTRIAQDGSAQFEIECR